YVLKDSPASVLLHALREAAAGRRFLSPPLSDDALNLYERKAGEESLDPYETLTNREREVLQLAAESYTSGQIGERLFISSRTVETHRANLMRKLGLKTQTDLIRYAIRKGILPVEE